MSYALSEIAALLRTPATVAGHVLGISGSTARIATPGGAVLASVQGALKTGDRCTITAGIARKAPASSNTYAL